MLSRWRDEVGDGYALGLTRLGLGVLLFWQALRAGRELTSGLYFGDVFHMPFLPESLVPSRAVYSVVVAIELLLAVLVAVGYKARFALVASALIGLYVLLCDRLQFHHNRYALLLFAFLVAFTPCDRSLVITGAPTAEGARRGFLWAQRLAQLQLAIIYLSSGGSKLLDVDWREGLVIGTRFAMYGHQAIERGVPRGVVEWMSQPMVTSALAKGAIATELFLSVGLFLRRTRVFALWWGVLFHLTIEVTSRVEIFTWLTLVAYTLFVTPDVQARKLFFDPTRPKGKILAKLVQLCDWLARFEVKPWEPDDLKRGHSIVVVRRDGSRATGIRAFAMCARCLPILFPLWAPFALVASFTKGGDLTSRT